MNELDQIKKIIQDIEKKYSWGSCANWTNYHFTTLSSDIEKITAKRISDSTLKRILGKKKTEKDIYTPQMYTKNTLAEFLGFNNWEEFCGGKDDRSQKTENREQRTEVGKQNYLLRTIKQLFASKKKVSFYCANPKSRIPYTAIFHYDISGIKEDVMMDTGNGYCLPLPRDKNMITEFYEKSGYFDVRLFTKKNPNLASVKLHNLSKGWQGGISSNDAAMTFKPFEDQAICREPGRLYVSPQNLQTKGIGLNSEFWTEYRYFEDMNADLDNLSVSIVAKNDPKEGGKNYNDIQLILVGENGRIVFRFIAPDAHCYVDLEFSEKIISGRYNELSVFSRDTHDWRNIEIRNTNKNIEIFFEKQKVYSNQYNVSLGRLKGMMVRFYGCGALKNVVISNLRDMTLYREDFI